MGPEVRDDGGGDEAGDRWTSQHQTQLRGAGRDGANTNHRKLEGSKNLGCFLALNRCLTT